MAHTCIHGGYLPTIGNNYLTFMGTYVVYYYYFLFFYGQIVYIVEKN